MKKTILIEVALLIGVSYFAMSCATLSKQECETANWYEKGNADGQQGYDATRFASYQESCAEHGIRPDQAEYSKGRSAGLRLFCTYESGMANGRRGYRYAGVCPPDLEAKFLEGHRIGIREYEIQQKEEELARKQRELQEREAQLRAQQNASAGVRPVTGVGGYNECRFNSDCRLQDSCSFGRCNRSGRECSFSSDCTVEGYCASSSRYIDGRYTSVNSCRY